MATNPASYKRRGQLYRRHLRANARFEEIAGSAVVAGFAELEDEETWAARLALTDLSTFPRAGFKGANAANWLDQQGARLPNQPNQSVRQDDDALIARLSSAEFLILSDLATKSALPAILQDRWSVDSPKRVYSLPRADSHCMFAISGIHSATMLSKVCSVDLRANKFGRHEIVQTSLAHVSVIIIRHDFAATPGLLVLSDASVTEYLWDSLLDAMLEFDGRPVGVAAIRTLGETEGVSSSL